MDYTQKRIVVFDTETTGLKAGVDNIIEIAAVELLRGNLTGNQFHAYLAPRKNIEMSAKNLHKMDNTYYTTFYSGMYESDKSVVESFLAFVGDSDLYGHNVTFDKRFLEAECAFWRIPCIPQDKFKCTMKLFHQTVSPVHPRLKPHNRLEDCCAFFKLNSKAGDFHGAIYDATMTAKMLKNVFEYKNSAFNVFRSQSLPERMLLSEEQFYQFQESKRVDKFLAKKRENDREVDEEIKMKMGVGAERKVKNSVQSSIDVEELLEEMEQDEIRQLTVKPQDEQINDQLLELILENEQTGSVSQEVPQKGKYRDLLKNFIEQIKEGN